MPHTHIHTYTLQTHHAILTHTLHTPHTHCKHTILTDYTPYIYHITQHRISPSHTHTHTHSHQLPRYTHKPHHHGSQLKASLGHFCSWVGGFLASLGGVPSSSLLPPLPLPLGILPLLESLTSSPSSTRAQWPPSLAPTLPGPLIPLLTPPHLLGWSFPDPSQGKSSGCKILGCHLSSVHFSSL